MALVVARTLVAVALAALLVQLLAAARTPAGLRAVAARLAAAAAIPAVLVARRVARLTVTVLTALRPPVASALLVVA